MGNNQSSVSHTIRAEGYKYDVFKGELSKGSTISKSKHPILEVEEYKQKLIARKILKDMRTHWVLKKNVRTGHLMSVNLHFGTHIKESPIKQDIIVTSDEAAELEGKLQEKQVCVSNSEIVMKSLVDTLRFSSAYIVQVNGDVMRNHGSDTFGQDEMFVLKLLQERGIISSSARHGFTGEKEADIVDEANGQQYEVVYEFKTELSKKKMKPDVVYSPEMLILQLVDSPFIHISKSLERKLKKEYTDRYTSNLVILTLATNKSTIAMLESLSEKLKREQIATLNYEKVYIISLDFLNEQAILVKIPSDESSNTEYFPCKNEELGLVEMTPVEFSDINDSQKYLMICDNIFDGTQRLRYDEGKELKDWMKSIHIKVPDA